MPTDTLSETSTALPEKDRVDLYVMKVRSECAKYVDLLRKIDTTDSPSLKKIARNAKELTFLQIKGILNNVNGLQEALIPNHNLLIAPHIKTLKELTPELESFMGSMSRSISNLKNPATQPTDYQAQISLLKEISSIYTSIIENASLLTKLAEQRLNKT